MDVRVEMARAAAARVGGRVGRGGEGGRRRGAVAARVAEGWAAEVATAGASISSRRWEFRPPSGRSRRW